MKISVIIPARNEEANIGRTLAALTAQSFPHSDFEIVLVDNGSTDNTVQVAAAYSSSLALKILHSSGGSIAHVRNDGAAAASGEILAFLDADCTPPIAWLQLATDLRPPSSIWGAHYAVPPDATWVGAIWEDFQATRVDGATSFLPSSNLFVHRHDFARLGGFAASQQTSEDVDFSLRARRLGLNVIAIPAMAIVHMGTPATLSQFFRQNYWHGRHVFRMFLRNFPALRSLPVILLSVYTLVMLLAIVVTPLIAIPEHHPALALLPIALFLLPALLLALQKTLRAGRLIQAPALALLYGVYLTARALALVLPAANGHRRPASKASR